MERKLEYGDYVPDGKGGLTTLSGAEEMLQRALFRLTARRGGLVLLPELGSELYKLLREKPSARQALAKQYAVQALQEESELAVTGVELSDRLDGGLDVTVKLEWRGTALQASLTLGEESTNEIGG